jgi:outer membrane murein-binding lipoprotein Lpp
MPFTVRDFQDLVRALERRAEWRAELRRLLLTDELLTLPEVVRGLADQVAGLTREVRDLTRQVRELAAGHASLVAEVRELARQVRELAAGHASLTARVDDLTVQVRELAAGHASLVAEVRELAGQVRELAAGHASLTARVDDLTVQVRELAQQVRDLTEQVRALVAAQRRTDDRLGRLEGRDLERWYRERASSVFHRILARARLVDHGELAPMLDAAVEAGSITEDERAEILLADVVVRGRREQREAYALAEVSVVVDAEDLRRAVARARLLERATGRPVVPVVAGERVAAGVAEEARAAGVWRLLDGRAEMEPPSA